MQITIQNEPREVLLQTISLRNNNNSHNTYLFRCFRCGNAIVQLVGEVSKIFPGLEPTNQVVVINQCSHCRERYTFQTHLYKQTYTRVVLSTKGKFISTFHCYICRNPLLQYDNHILLVLPSFHQVTLPFSLVCINSKCPARFTIEEIIGE